jgi:LPXTG-motif cell wall-anchored protein
MRLLAKLCGRFASALVIVAASAWGALALFYASPQTGALPSMLAGLFGLGGIVAAAFVLFSRRRWKAAGVFAAVFLLLLAWWSTIRPSNDRDWQPEVAVLPYATIDGDLVTLHNIRNFDYRSETDFTPAYYDKTFDLRRLDSVDLIATYWMGPQVAHIMLSFGFAGQDYVAFSIETRKERSEEYSTLKGFFRQYELYYVVADERDVIRVRTNYRKNPPEEVYVFRAHGPTENGRRLFMGYVRKINSLKDRPEFYNTLTTNCTTNILMHARVNPGHLHFNWKILLSGYAPEYVYEKGRFDTSLPFEELKKRSRINEAAQAADRAADFSQRIRDGRPGMKITKIAP